MPDISPGQRLLPTFDSSPELSCALDALAQVESFLHKHQAAKWLERRLPDECAAIMIAADRLSALLLAP